MKAGELVGVVVKPGLKSVLEAAGITESPVSALGDFPLVNGDPDGERGRHSLSPRWGGVLLARPSLRLIPKSSNPKWPGILSEKPRGEEQLKLFVIEPEETTEGKDQRIMSPLLYR